MRRAKSTAKNLVSRALSFLSPDEESAQEEACAPDLDPAPYQQRALDLLADYLEQDRGTPGQRVTALKVLVARLEQLLDDLASLSIDAAMIPLPELVREARRFIDSGSRDMAVLDDLAEHMREMLADMGRAPESAAPPPPTPGRSKGPFWK